jgi:hypothetical protein
VPALAGPGSARATRSAAERHAEIQGAFARLDDLVARARVPVSLDLVRLYRSYTPEQLAEPRSRAVDVEDVLDIAKDPTVPGPVREEAAKAVVWDSALRNDRKLDATGKAMGRPRAKFTKKVLPMLTDKDPLTRELGKRICEGLWPGFQDKDVQACNPADLDSCTAARRAWTKYIER